ncbi:dehydrodolichyl diphosphate synthase complex subunit NUS1 isoform X1 [Fagus crenata]
MPTQEVDKAQLWFSTCEIDLLKNQSRAQYTFLHLLNAGHVLPSWAFFAWTPKMQLRSRMELVQIGNFGLLLLWCILHFLVSIWYFLLEIAHVVESYIMSSGLMKNYKALDFGKLRYLGIVVGSEEASQTSKVIELLQWLEAMGVKHVCLYDTEGEGCVSSTEVEVLL